MRSLLLLVCNPTAPNNHRPNNEMSNPATAETKSPNRTESPLPDRARGNTPADLTTNDGLFLTGEVMSVDFPVNRSGISKSGKPYSMNMRTFQIYAGNKLYNCQDSRNDEKDSSGSIVKLGLDCFPHIERKSVITVKVTDFDISGITVRQLNVDTTGL